MSIRNVYWVLLVGLSLVLLFEWTSEKRSKSVNEHLSNANKPSFSVGEGYVAIESDELYVVISVSSGNIVETRLKKYLVENVVGSMGYRVFGEAKESAFSYYFKSGFTNTAPRFFNRS